MADLVFPEGFLWGASTSSHQIEGGNVHNHWWAAEIAGTVPFRSGAACDSWNRWQHDIDTAVEIGLDTYRFSVEWSRIEPVAGRFDEDALARYAAMARYAKERGLTVMVVLWHFTDPVWFFDQGGWDWSEAPARFAAYARRVGRSLGGHVDWWATLNEANTYVNHGWMTGSWPPFRRTDAWGSLRMYRRLAAGHSAAYDALRAELGPEARIGLTHVMPWAHPATRRGRFSGLHQAYYRWAGAEYFLDRVRDRLDWLGVQYYHDSPCVPFGVDDADQDPPRTDMGWRIMPEGIYHATLHAWERYRVPVIITENGLADATDRQRGRFIVDHLAWLHRAIEAGADVRGYLHWSLLDNFEWAHGFGPRFGLAEVDYDTFERRIRPSARLYGRIAREGRVSTQMGEGLSYGNGRGSLAPASFVEA